MGRCVGAGGAVDIGTNGTPGNEIDMMPVK